MLIDCHYSHSCCDKVIHPEVQQRQAEGSLIYPGSDARIFSCGRPDKKWILDSRSLWDLNMALVRRDCMGVGGGSTHFLKEMHDLTEDAGDQGSLLSVSDIPCPGHFLSVSLFLSCLYVSSSAPLCSFSHDALPHHRLRNSLLCIKTVSQEEEHSPSCVAFLGTSSHTVGKGATTRPEEERVGIPGKAQLYRREHIIHHTQMAERTKINPEAVHYLWNSSLHLGKQGYIHTRLATGESKPPNKSGVLFWCKIIVL